MKAPWSRRKRAPVVPAPEPDSAERAAAEAFVSEAAWRSIAPGFRSKEDVLAQIIELVDDDPDLPLTGAEAAGIVERLWARRLDELGRQSDRDPSDDVRVGAAFAELEVSGVVARMNFGFDQGDGSHEARQLAKAAGARGFVYFHEQDAERLAYPDATLYLGWDAVDTTREEFDAATIRLGEELRDVMERQGLTVEWDGTLAQRPAVVHLEWRRPLPA